MQKNAGWDDGCIGASLVCFFFFSFFFFFFFVEVYFAFSFFWVGELDEKEWIDGGREEEENEREVGWKRGFFG